LATPPYLLALSNTASNFPHVTSWIQMGRHVTIWGWRGRGYSPKATARANGRGARKPRLPFTTVLSILATAFVRQLL